MGVNFISSNDMNLINIINKLRINTLTLVTIFDYNMFQIWFTLFIETFPNDAPYFPNNVPCFPMDKDVDRVTISLYQLVCGVISGDTLVCRH